MDPNLDPGRTEFLPESARSLPEAAQPVVEEPNPYAFARSGGEGVAELLPHVVVADEVVLEVNVIRSRTNRREPRGVVFGAILEQAHLVTADERGTCGTGEHPIGELTQPRLGVFTAIDPHFATHLAAACDEPSTTFAKRTLSPSAIVGCVRMASRSPAYGRPASIAVWTTAITSPASAPSIVKPRMRSLFVSMSAFMKPRVSPSARARRTDVIGSRATRTSIPRRCASVSPSPTRPSCGSVNAQ